MFRFDFRVKHVFETHNIGKRPSPERLENNSFFRYHSWRLHNTDYHTVAEGQYGMRRGQRDEKGDEGQRLVL